jgi:hypothetical protein
MFSYLTSRPRQVNLEHERRDPNYTKKKHDLSATVKKQNLKFARISSYAGPGVVINCETRILPEYTKQNKHKHK